MIISDSNSNLNVKYALILLEEIVVIGRKGNIIVSFLIEINASETQIGNVMMHELPIICNRKYFDYFSLRSRGFVDKNSLKFRNI